MNGSLKQAICFTLGLGVKGVSFGPTIWSRIKGVLNQHIYKVVPRANIDLYWLFLALRFVTGKIESQAHGFKSSLVHVHKEDITSQLVDVPAPDEQEGIAATVRAWDEAIVKCTLIIQKLVERRRALSSRLLSEGHRKGIPTLFGEILKERAGLVALMAHRHARLRSNSTEKVLSTNPRTILGALTRPAITTY